LGYPHPDVLIDNLSAKQISEWEAFNRIQPIGQRRLDVYFSFMMTTLHNIVIGFSGSKTAKQFKVEDFVPNWTGLTEKPDEVVMTEEKMKEVLLAFAQTHNQQVTRNQTRDSTPPKTIKQ
jgi:hypothetical protein